MNKLDKESIIGISALLVHAANIDENYTEQEKDLVKKFIKSFKLSNITRLERLNFDLISLFVAKKDG